MLEKKILTHPSLVFTVDIQAICAPLKETKIEYFSHVISSFFNTFTLR